MNHPSKIDAYLKRYGARPDRPLRAASREGIERVVVIPALAESASLFKTLAALAANPPGELASTLVLCVVNNHPPPLADREWICDNQRTLEILEELLEGSTGRFTGTETGDDLRKIAGSALRLGWIDASSPGSEIPEGDGGVGTARKIGMDAALELVAGKGEGQGVICGLDADTLVEENYLAAVGSHFSGSRDGAAVVAYAHRMPQDPMMMAAICDYEIFLRAYVIGLSLAGSPYAFHSIGSTMACTARAYADVRGMNRRRAAEDFHFLNKLAKIGSVATIASTTVFPSPRVSARVPFGTGRTMTTLMSGTREGCRLHDPRIFAMLRRWLEAMRSDPDRGTGEILTLAQEIHPGLAEYLRLDRFDIAWPNIRRNCADAPHLLKGFHVWFDGLKTLRFIHHMSRTVFPPVPMAAGLSGLLDGSEGLASLAALAGAVPGVDWKLRILEELRRRFPDS